jgi:MFS family permease
VARLLTVPVFFWIENRSALALVVGTTILGLVSSLSFGAFYTAITESLPKRIRGGALAMMYATSIALFGGTTQLVITWLIHIMGNPRAPAWHLVAATAVGQIAFMLILESAPAKTLLATVPVSAR